MSDFVHLHLHTLYSLLDGAIRVPELVSTVKSKGMNSVAVTDHGNMFGTIAFYREAKKQGIKPILGIEAYIAPKGMTDRSERLAHHLILLAENDEGYANLRSIASAAYRNGHYYHPRVDKPYLQSHAKGLFALSACLAGEVPFHVRNGSMDKARQSVLDYKSIFDPGHFFLEVQSNGLDEQRQVNVGLAQLARDSGVELAATADSHYVSRQQARAHEVLMCIASGKTLSDAKRLHHETEELYIKSPEEMLAALSDFPNAVANTARIAAACNVELKLGKPELPSFKVPEGYDDNSYVTRLAREGLDRRLRDLPYPVDRDGYFARLEMEIGVITKMGFAGYFLIVQDFINWAKAQGIPVGPGRGSGAGSIAAWSLGITDLDPIRHKLLFERFLNPERISMPDFDVDFCQDRREEVIHYVTDKYGKENVGQIITFGQLKAKSVIRDVCRVIGLPYSEGDRVAKLVPEILNITLKEAIDKEPRLKELYEKPTGFGVRVPGPDGEKEITTKDLLDIGIALEGLNRQAGMHAAGVVISDRPLSEVVPLYQPPDENVLVTQFAKDEVELVGLVKFDFLGLKTLTVIRNALNLVNRGRPEAERFVESKLPLEDAATFELISRGDTAGVFQMESSGFTEMVKRLRPSCFEDIVAAGALFRPGPLNAGMVDEYIERKHGRRKVQFPHPKLELILKDTYGVIVYQEQVMQIAQVLAGYSLGRADLLRKAMGKKIAEVMAKERDGFVAGCIKGGVSEKLASDIFTDMEKFAAYGFNRSHSAAYAVLSMQTGYLKAHFPVEFMAALLTSEKDNTDKVVRHIAEARASGIEVLSPDVNESELAFGAVGGKIRFGLGAIKGVGESAVESVLAARKDGPFKGLFDFCDRVDTQKVNKKSLEALVKGGAFDFVGVPRSRLYDNIERAAARGQNAQRDRVSGQVSLFGALRAAEPIDEKAIYGRAEEWGERERLTFEKEALGFYITGHPLTQFEKELARYARPCAKVQEARAQDKVTIAGVVASMRERSLKDGRRMAFVTLEDLSGSAEVICFPGRANGSEFDGEKWKKGGPRPGYVDWEPMLKSGDPVLISGAVQIDTRDEENARAEVVAESVQLLSEVRAKKAKRVEIHLAGSAIDDAKLEQLRALIGKYPGNVGVAVVLSLPGQAEVTVALPQAKVALKDELLESIDRLFGERATQVAG
jgi:DNA polymerase III subunit alpha